MRKCEQTVGGGTIVRSPPVDKAANSLRNVDHQREVLKLSLVDDILNLDNFEGFLLHANYSVHAALADLASAILEIGYS